MNTKIFLSSCIVLLPLFGCQKSNSDEPNNPSPDPDSEDKIEISINPSISVRATEYGFETNDKIGLFVVNYNGSTPGNLLNSGNHVDNMRFTYSGVWTPDSPIYWKDKTTHADFYLYYPYSAVSNTTAYPFTVKADQSAETNYKASDMLVGKATNVAPTAEAISIPINHVMSRMNIQLEPGNGFTKESLASANISVKVDGLKNGSTVNLATGAVTATGNATAMKPYKVDGVYKAIVVPQTVAETNLITVTVDGRDFTFKKGFTFEAGKSHNFTVTLSKTSNGINVNINPWNEDGTDNGGTAE